MSIEAIAAARKIRDIPSRDKFVLMALADYANDRYLAWPSLETLSEWTCMSRSTVARALEALEDDHGLVRSQRRFRENGSETSKRYFLAFMGHRNPPPERHLDGSPVPEEDRDACHDDWDYQAPEEAQARTVQARPTQEYRGVAQRDTPHSAKLDASKTRGYVSVTYPIHKQDYGGESPVTPPEQSMNLKTQRRFANANLLSRGASLRASGHRETQETHPEDKTPTRRSGSGAGSGSSGSGAGAGAGAGARASAKPAGNFKNLEAGSEKPEGARSEGPSPEFASKLAKMAAREKQKRKPNKYTLFITGSYAAWNKHKHPSWTTHNGRISGREKALFSEIWQYADKDLEKALEIVTKGVAWASRNEQWAESQVLTFAQLASNSKLIDYYQKFNDYEARRRPGKQGVGSESGPRAGSASRGAVAAARGIVVGGLARYQGGPAVYILKTQGVLITIAPLMASGEPNLSEQSTVYLDQLTPHGSADA